MTIPDLEGGDEGLIERLERLEKRLVAIRAIHQDSPAAITISEAASRLTVLTEELKAARNEGNSSANASPSPLAATRHSSVEGEWVLVPREPTRTMLNAAIDVDSYRLGDISPLGFRISPQMLFERCWGAMLSAAPAGPTERQLQPRDAIRHGSEESAEGGGLLEAARDALAELGKVGAISSLNAKVAKGRAYEDWMAIRKSASIGCGVLRKALTTPPPSPQDHLSEPGWRPIADHDGSRETVLIAGTYPNGCPWVEMGNWVLSGHWLGHKIDKPTHFMPLPAPPSEEKGS